MLACGLGVPTPVAATAIQEIAAQPAETAPPASFDAFLDRLMTAESGGRSDAKNPRSTALGPFQFIESTFLEITRRHFPSETAGLTEKQTLRLRTDAVFARRAAAVFCRENIRYLKERGHEPTFAHLRLAFLLGPADAARIMQAQAHRPLTQVLSAPVVKANPFMRRMSVADLLARSARDVAHDRTERVAAVASPQSDARPARRGGASAPKRAPERSAARTAAPSGKSRKGSRA